MEKEPKTLQEAEEALAERILNVIFQHQENRARVSAAEHIAMIQSHCQSYYGQLHKLRKEWKKGMSFTADDIKLLEAYRVAAEEDCARVRELLNMKDE